MKLSTKALLAAALLALYSLLFLLLDLCARRWP
jgi:hypothetical protein